MQVLSNKLQITLLNFKKFQIYVLTGVKILGVVQLELVRITSKHMNLAQFPLLHGALFLGCIHGPLGRPMLKEKMKNNYSNKLNFKPLNRL